jgi:hypothetical protein
LVGTGGVYLRPLSRDMVSGFDRWTVPTQKWCRPTCVREKRTRGRLGGAMDRLFKNTRRGRDGGYPLHQKEPAGVPWVMCRRSAHGKTVVENHGGPGTSVGVLRSAPKTASIVWFMIASGPIHGKSRDYICATSSIRRRRCGRVRPRRLSNTFWTTAACREAASTPGARRLPGSHVRVYRTRSYEARLIAGCAYELAMEVLLHESILCTTCNDSGNQLDLCLFGGT